MPTLPQTGVVAGLAGLVVLGGSALLTSGLVLASKKGKAESPSAKEASSQNIEDEYHEMFGD